jgi:hypothetical protein
MNLPNLPTDPTRIIILQSTADGLEIIRPLLRSELGMEAGINFTGIRGPAVLETLIQNNGPQLLITGIMALDRPQAELLRKFKERNPHLMLVAYSSFRNLEGQYDMEICRADQDAPHQLIAVISDFIGRQLNAA